MSNYQNIAKAKAIEKQNRERLLKINPKLNDGSGIYFLLRTDENGFRFAYLGQAKNITQRLCGHLAGYQQHIDRSLKAHGLYSEDNPLEEYSITLPSTDYELVMRRKKPKQEREPIE